jgi:hypothetical protein
MKRLSSCLQVVLLAALLGACSDEIKEVTPTSQPQEQARTVVASTATAVPPSPTPAPKRVGEPVLFTGTISGRPVRFSITLNAIRDPATSSNQFNRPSGRWVVLDWTIRNEGTENASFVGLDLKILTTEDFVIGRGNHAGHPEPQLDAFPTLGPGQAIRGFAAYDVPAAAGLKAAIYHPSGSPQFIVAELP